VITLSSLVKAILGPGLRPAGDVYPSKPNPPVPAVDGRTSALRLLGAYLTSFVYAIPGDTNGPSIPFRIPPGNFYVNWPDYEQDVEFPAIAVLPGAGTTKACSFVPAIIEETAGIRGKNTVLMRMEEYVEVFQLDLWCSKLPELRGILSTFDVAFNPTEQMSGVRLVMRDFYDQTVRFTMLGRTIVETGSGQNRRRASIEIRMEFNVVALINTVTMKPQAIVQMDHSNLYDVQDPDGSLTNTGLWPPPYDYPDPATKA